MHRILAALACAALWTAAAAAADTAPLDLEHATAEALRQAGGGTVVESEVDRKRDGRTIYEFEIVHDGMETEVDIDAANGAVVKLKRERGRRHAAPRLDAASAQEKAVEQAGGGSVVKYELDRDDGRLLHEVTVVHNGERVRVEIDDADGSVVKYARKR